METENMSEQWRNSWREFVRLVAKLANEGSDSDAILKAFAGETVHWEGTVLRNEVLEKYAPRIVLRMQCDAIELESGHVLRAEWLAVGVPSFLASRFKDVEAGKIFHFTAKIVDKLPVSFAKPVELVRSKLDNEAHIEISLNVT